MCRCVERKGKQGLAKCGEEHGSHSEGNIMGEQSKGCELFCQHLPAPFTAAAVKRGISLKLKNVSRRMLSQIRENLVPTL